MIDFNKGSYIERSLDGNTDYDKERVKVDDKGNIFFLNDTPFVKAKDIVSIIILQEFTYLKSSKDEGNKIIPAVVGLILTCLALWLTSHLLNIPLDNMFFMFTLIVLYLPTIGLLGYYLTTNLIKPNNKTAICYEVNLEWPEHEYIMIVSEKDYRRILNR